MSRQPDKPRENSFRDARKQILRSAFLALAALGVIVFACYAWFVSNNSVTGKISSVLLNGDSFELASVGTAGGVWDEKIPDYAQLAPEEWTHEGKTYYSTSGSKNTVLWKLTPNSNLKNYPEGEAQQATGIQPGTEGSITFYVIPKMNGDIKLEFQIELLPFQQSNDPAASPVLVENNSDLDNLLKGHFLFYLGENDSRQWVPCDTGKFEIEFKKCEADTPIPVTLSWKWPLLLQHITGETGIPDQISDVNKRHHFFYADPDKGEEMPPKIELSSDFQLLNKLFNNADQYIGKNMQWLEVCLSAKLI